LPKMHNLIQDQASVVKIKGLRTNNNTPALYDDKAREAVWVKPDNAEELLAKQNSRYFQVVQKPRNVEKRIKAVVGNIRSGGC
jgi:hypothetical protein